MDNAVATFTNTQDGITSFVFVATIGGFNVTLRDDDSGEFVGIALNFKDEAKAIAKAKEIVK
jgi:hypothetical protein